jgi:hypothetical protein
MRYIIVPKYFRCPDYSMLAFAGKTQAGKNIWPYKTDLPFRPGPLAAIAAEGC